MKKQKYFIFLWPIIFLSGCAGHTTDPREGGLFSYNPDAYEKRLEERRNRLAAIEQSIQTETKKTDKLETTKTSQTKKNEELRGKIADLTANTAILDRELRNAQLQTTAKQQEREIICRKLKELQSSLALADDGDDTEEKLLELERLEKQRDALEQEAAILLGL